MIMSPQRIHPKDSQFVGKLAKEHKTTQERDLCCMWDKNKYKYIYTKCSAMLLLFAANQIEFRTKNNKYKVCTVHLRGINRGISPINGENSFW